ncbi:MAG: prolipoprotein diacylglyceryl transferase [Bacillota bacterium]
MYNDILKLGPITIHGYGLMIAIGVAFALLMAVKRAKKYDLDEDIIYGLGIVTLISGVAGAKLLYCIVEIKSIIADPSLILSSGGFVIYGGIIGGVAAAILYCRFKKVSFMQYFNLAAPSVALAQGFGRIGCFLAGCCYGRETDSICGIAFHNSPYAPNGVKLIPTQLFSSAGSFLIAAVLIIYARKTSNKGNIGALYLVLYSVGRFIIEFFRNDHRGSIGILSTSQFISIILLIIGIALILLKDRLCHKEEQMVQ